MKVKIILILNYELILNSLYILGVKVFIADSWMLTLRVDIKGLFT